MTNTSTEWNDWHRRMEDDYDELPNVDAWPTVDSATGWQDWPDNAD